MSKRTVIVLAAMAVAAAGWGTVARAQSKKKATVTIVNKADWAIHHLYLSPVDDEEWGEDQLGEHVVEKGESFQLSGIPCDTYDVKLVEEDGDECVVEEVDICGKNDTWQITSKDLLKCQGQTG